MDTVGFVIDEIRERLRETSDDTNVEDLLIYSTMCDVRLMLIDQQLTKEKSVDINLYQTVCIDLCRDNYANCCDLPDLGIEILKSKKVIPEFVTHKYLKPFYITDVTGQNVIDRQDRSLLKWDEYFDIDNILPVPTWDMLNMKSERRIIISDDLNIKTILATGIFKDVSAAGLLMDCEDETCPDWKDIVFPISDLKSILIDMVIDKLGRTVMIPEDNSNNGKSLVNDRD